MISPVGVCSLHQALILILNTQLPLLLNRAVNSFVWLDKLFLQYVVVLLRVIKESLSVDSSSLLYYICLGVLLCSGEVISLVPLMINNAVPRVVTDHLVVTCGDLLVGRVVILRPVHRTVFLLILALHQLFLLQVTGHVLLFSEGGVPEAVRLVDSHAVLGVLLHIQVT